MTQGIYEIHCYKTGKRYIGSSKHIEKRWQSHISQLRKGRHHNWPLQKAYNTYGEDNLTFSIIKQIEDLEMLLEAEEFYIRSYSYNKLFNSARKPGFVPRYKSRWMQHCDFKRKHGDEEDEYAWGE